MQIWKLAIAGAIFLGLGSLVSCSPGGSRNVLSDEGSSSPDGTREILSDNDSNPQHIIKVLDGDTITVIENGKETNTRLCGIEAPPIDQPLGQQSKQYLVKLISGGEEKVEVHPVKGNHSKIAVSEVFIVDENTGDKLINREMVKAGMAYLYKQNLKSCLNAALLEEAEEQARRSRIGVWSKSPKSTLR
ncbi:MAG TPA: thermonuclease family protein [Candidatus Obscuribacterales bacterium]